MPSFSFETSFDRFNRYMVECEYDPLDGYKGQDCFLIDTWWNVNVRNNYLIVHITCFNRYMVECESFCGSFSIKFGDVLIDTWWNVNYSFLNSMSNMLEF